MTDRPKSSAEDRPPGNAPRRLGRNIKGYCGETIDIDTVLERCISAARSSGWGIETIRSQSEPELLAFVRFGSRKNGGLQPPRRRVYISTGIHGDEPAGPLAVQRLLEENKWPDNLDLWICPCLNPAGFTLNRRENAPGGGPQPRIP